MPVWQIWLGGALAIALGVAIAILTAGLFIILAPVALIAWLIYRIRYGSNVGQRGEDRIIEVDYTVVEPRDGKNDPPIRTRLPKRPLS